MTDGLRIIPHGLDELNRDLDALEGALEHELGREATSLTSDIVDDARGIARGLGGVAAKSAPAVTATGDARGDWFGDAVTLNGDAYPFAAGAEFGSERYPQFASFRGSGSDAGYFLYPAIRRAGANLDDLLYEGVDRALARTDLD